MRAAHDALEAAAVLDLTCASTFLPGVPAIISNGVDDRWSWVRCVLVGPVVIGGVRSYFLNTVITVQHRLDNGTTVLHSVPGAGIETSRATDFPAAMGVDDADVVEILLQEGGHTMPTTGFGRPAVIAAVVPRSISATHVWIESASQRRHSAESRSGASQTSFRGM